MACGDVPLYTLDDPLLNSAMRGTTIGLDDYSDMETAARGEQTESRRIVVRQDMGRKALDVIWVSLLPFVHERVVRLLSDAGAAGWATYPVEVFNRKGEPLPGYFGLSITGRCQSMFLDAEHSKLVYVKYPMGFGAKYRGLSVSMDSWDGSDLFTCSDRRNRFTVVTHKVQDLFAQAKVTNVGFCPLERVESSGAGMHFIPFCTAVRPR